MQQDTLGHDDPRPPSRTRSTRPPLTLRQTLAISRAIADPSRFEVLGIIARGEARCADLKSCLTITAPTLSHHMKELESAGLIETTRTGKFVTATFSQETWNAYVATLRSLGIRALPQQESSAGPKRDCVS